MTKFRTIIHMTVASSKRRLVIQVIFFSLASALVALLSPIIQKYLIDTLAEVKVNEVHTWIALLIIVVILQLLLGIRKNYTCSLVEVYSSYNLCKNILCNLFRTSYEKIHDTDPDYLYNRIKSDSDTLAGFMRKIFENFVPNSIAFIAAVIYYLLKAPILLMALLLILICFAISYILLQKKMDSAAQNYKEQQNRSYSTFNQSVSNISTIKINCWGSFESKRLENSMEMAIGAYKQILKFTIFFLSIASSLQIIFTLLVITIGALFVVNGTLSIGDLFALVSFSAMVISPLISFIEILSTFPEACASLSRIQELEELEKERDGTVIINGINEIDIDIESILYKNFVITSPIHYHFERGHLYIINGANGAGKSSLLNLIAKLHQSYTGTIRINKTVNLKELSMDDIASKISYVEQENHLFTGTIEENIFFGQSTEAFQGIIPDFLKHFLYSLSKLQNGLKEVISSDGTSTLSGGERKKVSIARALLKDADVILLDEPTASLDVDSIQVLFDILIELKQTKTIILVTHENKYNHFADEIINITRHTPD